MLVLLVCFFMFCNFYQLDLHMLHYQNYDEASPKMGLKIGLSWFSYGDHECMFVGSLMEYSRVQHAYEFFWPRTFSPVCKNFEEL